MLELVKQYTGLDFDNQPLDQLIAQAAQMGVELDKDASWGKALYEVFDQKVEEKLIQPVFVMDYPVEVSPLPTQRPPPYQGFEILLPQEMATLSAN